jgi:hypothetical protein
MEQHHQPYCFAIFSSAETIAEVGVDFLVRLGVCLVWVGVESKKTLFSKLRDIDVHSLMAELQAKGITVISSSILFAEHHDKVTLEQEIDWAIALGTDLHQFMQLIPFPGTPLYSKYLAEGKMIPDFPYTKLHGQDELAFYHPHFTSREAGKLTQRAFRKKYETDGPGVLNMALTAIRGYTRAKEDMKSREEAGLSWNPQTLHYERSTAYQPDEFMNFRVEKMRQRALEFRPIMLSARIFAPNSGARKKAAQAAALCHGILGKPNLKERAKSLALVCFATLEWFRIRVKRLFSRGEIVRQPPNRRLEYNKECSVSSHLEGTEMATGLHQCSSPSRHYGLAIHKGR